MTLLVGPVAMVSSKRVETTSYERRLFIIATLALCDLKIGQPSGSIHCIVELDRSVDIPEISSHIQAQRSSTCMVNVGHHQLQ